ncbi:hypothetical protein, partial [Helicobacter sp. CLO-3]|uniref:hypothetical protein n=1 Tax=Helicobacter sp. CLO-3 TaxID=211 RepID=UPI001C408E29
MSINQITQRLSQTKNKHPSALLICFNPSKLFACITPHTKKAKNTKAPKTKGKKTTLNHKPQTPKPKGG